MEQTLKAINKQDILAADDLVKEPVEVPEWGGVVYVQSLTAQEVVKFWEEQEIIDQSTGKIGFDLGAFLVRVVVDAEGNKIFRQEDKTALMNKSRVVIDRLASVGFRLNAINKGTAEDKEKNSNAGA